MGKLMWPQYFIAAMFSFMCEGNLKIKLNMQGILKYITHVFYLRNLPEQGRLHQKKKKKNNSVLFNVLYVMFILPNIGIATSDFPLPTLVYSSYELQCFISSYIQYMVRTCFFYLLKFMSQFLLKSVFFYLSYLHFYDRCFDLILLYQCLFMCDPIFGFLAVFYFLSVDI